MDKKSIIAIVLSFAVLYVYQTFFVKPYPAIKPAAVQQQEAAPNTATEKSAANVVSENDAPAGNAPILLQSNVVAAQEIPFETDEYRAVFTNRGAGLKSFQLKKYRVSIEKGADFIELVNAKENMPPPLKVGFAGSDFTIPEDAIYEVRAENGPTEDPAAAGRLVFTLEYPEHVKVEKIYTFYRGKYNLTLEIRVTNLSGSTLNELNTVSWYELIDPEAETDSYSHDGPVSLVAGSVERTDVKKMAPEKILGPEVSWSGFESKYFLAALVPSSPSLTTLSLVKDGPDKVIVSLKAPRNIIPPGQTGLTNYSLYLGPKDYSLLKELNAGLENAIDFGDWLKWLAMPLLIILKFLHGSVVHNYGVAIIILTALIKLIFWPLGNKSYRSMKEMQKLQPLMTELRDKYKEDKARLSQEMMALYKAHKVNPMGGCLPMVIQIPVFFGLYKTLLNAIELRHSPLIWWIQDLSAKDPYYITPIIMGGTMFLQQKMTPPAGDPMQAKIMLFMPIIFTAMFLNFPSGLVIYWLFNNLISIGQQYYINKSN